MASSYLPFLQNLGTPVNPTPPPTAAPDSGGDGTDWSGVLSGLSGLFGTIGAGVSSGFRAANLGSAPTPGSGWVFNPSTGQYYNPLTGQALTSTGTLTSAGLLPGLGGQNSGLLLILLAAIAFFAFRKKAA